MKAIYIIIPVVVAAAIVGYATYAPTLAKVRQEKTASADDPFVGRDGKKEAEVDLAGGKLVILEYGMYPPWDKERREVARARFELEIRPLAGCVITKPLVTFVDAYNRVMAQEIESRFGSDVLDRIDREGRAILEERWKKNA